MWGVHDLFQMVTGIFSVCIKIHLANLMSVLALCTECSQCVYYCFRELVKLLHERGTKVYLVSGGFRSIIEPAAKLLHIPYTSIFANRLKFFYNGIVV
jgi:phosphoserine phosphatase